MKWWHLRVRKHHVVEIYTRPAMDWEYRYVLDDYDEIVTVCSCGKQWEEYVLI